MSVTTDSDITGLGGSGGGVWGTITGTLADQTDLQAALDARVTGPGSATDEAIARYDGTTGKLLQNSTVTISDTGVVSLASGAIGAPSLKFASDASDIGWYRSAAGEWSYAWGSSKRVFSVGSSGVGFHSTSANAASLYANVSGNSGTFTWQFDANIGTWIIQNTSIGGDVIFRLSNANTGGLGWALDSLGSGNGDYVGGFVLSSDRSGAQVPLHVGKWDAVSIGGNNSLLHRNSTTLVDRPQTTLTGTGTASASTTLTGSSTLFITQLAPGDRISVDSGSTFVTVLSIASNTSCTLDTAVTCTGASILRRSGTGFVDRTGTAWKGVLNDQGRLGLGLVNPASLIHVDGGDATASELRFTAGTTTGRTSSDGFQVGVTTTGKAEIRQRENLAMEFYTNNTARAIIQAAGRLTVGDTTEAIGFFTNNATKFMANGEITTVSSGLSDIIQIGATTAFEANPSADTNSGLGVGVYAAQGFNLNLEGSSKFNGGIPIAGYPNPISAVGAFGQCNVRTDDTVDGAIGLLCSGGTQGTGATVDDYVAGAFACSTSADFASGGSLNRGTGGFFTVYTDLDSDTPITTARGGWFYEPYVTGGGTATITNKTAVEIQGTLSITEDDDSSTGNIDAFALTTSYQYMTGAAPVLRGVIPDTFNKVIVFDFANTATISNEHATPTANRRITTGTGADLTNVKSACLVYNTTTSRWRVQWWRV